MAHPLAGKPAPKELLVDVPDLLRRYAAESPDPKDPAQRVAFGTSGHRGSSLRRSFNEAHILAVAQAVGGAPRPRRRRRPALPRGGHPRALGARGALGPRGARRERGRGRDLPGGRAGADPGHLARDPRPQSRPDHRPRRRHRRDAVAQPAGGRRHQVQPARRRAGGHRRHRRHRAARERAPRRREPRGEAHPVRARAEGGERPGPGLRRAVREGPPLRRGPRGGARGAAPDRRRSPRRLQRPLLGRDRGRSSASTSPS